MLRFMSSKRKIRKAKIKLFSRHNGSGLLDEIIIYTSSKIKGHFL